MSKERALLLTYIGTWLVSLAVVLWGIPRVLAIASLGSEGKEVIAKVLSYSTELCSGRQIRNCYVHLLAADGHTFFPLVLLEPHAPGSEMQITYLPADPTIFVRAPKSEPSWKYIWLRFRRQRDDIGWWAFALLFFLGTSIYLIRVAVNRDRPTVAQLLAAKDAPGSVSVSAVRRIVVVAFALTLLTMVVAIAIRLTNSG
jgi:hypothetical protein